MYTEKLDVRQFLFRVFIRIRRTDNVGVFPSSIPEFWRIYAGSDARCTLYGWEYAGGKVVGSRNGNAPLLTRPKCRHVFEKSILLLLLSVERINNAKAIMSSFSSTYTGSGSRRYSSFRRVPSNFEGSIQDYAQGALRVWVPMTICGRQCVRGKNGNAPLLVRHELKHLFKKNTLFLS